MNHIFIGFDPRQLISYNVLQSSILTRTKERVSIAPISSLTFPCKRAGLTPFTWARFLAPWACDFQGWSLFMDADILVRCDVKELFDLADNDCAAMVVKHPRMQFEDGSLILFNNAHPDNAKLTPEFVETAPGLHGIGWTHRVGELPPAFNHLVEYDDYSTDAKILHYTQGIPCWPETQNCQYAEDWQQEAQKAFSAQPWQTILGPSVHAKAVYQRLAKERDVAHRQSAS